MPATLLGSTRNSWERAAWVVAGCALASACVFGCGGHAQYAAPVLAPPSSTATQAQAQKLIAQFIADLDAKRYLEADAMVSAAIKSDWSPAHVQHHLKADGYWMLVGSKNWQYNEVQSLKHGDEVVVHAQFTNDPKNMLYHTNFSLARSGSDWHIDYVMNPVQRTRAVAVHIAGPAQSRR